MFDIVCQTYDICILRYWLDIDSISNVQKWRSISRYDIKLDIEVKILDIDALRYRRNIDIEPFFYRHRLITISKKRRYRTFLYRYRLITISKKRRYRSAKLRYWYIPISNIFSISINAPSISIYDVKAFWFDIECHVLRYRCFTVSLPGLL
jgi:hypothetical protein